jgi:hypothetical protein
VKTLLTALVQFAAPLAAGAASAQEAAATLPNTFDRPAAVAPTGAPPAADSDPARAAAAEAALRVQIAAFQAGAPDYEAMTPGLAEAVRGQAAAVTPLIQGFGDLMALEYVGTENGAELFMVLFDKAATQWIIGLDAEGKLGAMLFRPAPEAAEPAEPAEPAA